MEAIEELNRIFHFEVTTREQYHDINNRPTNLSPSAKLHLAMLEDAINCYKQAGSIPSLCGSTKHGYDPLTFARRRLTRKELAAQEAARWLFTDEPALITARMCCEQLGINLEYLRAGLRVMRMDGKRLRRRPVKANDAA